MVVLSVSCGIYFWEVVPKRICTQMQAQQKVMEMGFHISQFLLFDCQNPEWLFSGKRILVANSITPVMTRAITAWMHLRTCLFAGPSL